MGWRMGDLPARLGKFADSFLRMVFKSDGFIDRGGHFLVSWHGARAQTQEMQDLQEFRFCR